MLNFINTKTTESLIIDNAVNKQVIDGFTVPVTSIFIQKYSSTIRNNSILVEIPDDVFLEYKQKPKYMSYKLYDTTNLWYILLWLNSMTCVTQFTKNRLLIYDPNKLDVLATILNAEDKL